MAKLSRFPGNIIKSGFHVHNTDKRKGKARHVYEQTIERMCREMKLNKVIWCQTY